MAVKLNSAGNSHAASLISSGNVDKTSDWSFSADEGNSLLGAGGDDWANYAKWFLGEDDSQDPNTKGRYKYPFGKDGKVYQSALDAIRSRSSQQSDTSIYDAAGELLNKIDPDNSNKSAKRIQHKRQNPEGVQRAYSQLTIKAAVDPTSGQRIIRGTASTPTMDRMGDIVLPLGAQYKLPIALLWQHNADQPIGWITEATVTAQGIDIVAEVSSFDQPGQLKDFLDYAWQSIQAGLVRGLSIGFNPIKYAFMDDSWGIEFQEWEWLELSAVTIPANSEATISAIKSIDNRQLAALGNKAKAGVVFLGKSSKTTGASVSLKPHVAKTNPNEGKNMNVKEQIADFKKRREENLAKMVQLMTKAGDEGRTLDQTEQQEYEQLEVDNGAIEKHLPRLETLAKSLETTAAPVQGQNENQGANSRVLATVRNTQKLDKGIEFARYAMCLGVAKGNIQQASAIAQNRFPEMDRVNNVLKSAVAAGTTTDATWAGPLVEYNEFTGDFVEFLRPQTIIGKFGNGGIPSFRRVPFNVHIKGQISGGAGYWVGEGQPKPVTKFDFNNVYLPWAKVANIAVLTEELLRFSNPSAEALVRDALAEALIARLDIDFVDPAKALVANVSPASITNGVTAIHSSGNTADDVRADLAALWAPFILNNISPTTAVYIMTPTTALALSLMRNALGQPEFAGININGGTLEGIPVITSNYVPTTSAGSLVILANASDIWMADDGQVVIAASTEASLQMDTAPTNNSPTPTATTLVSMFQTDSVALRAERFINWQKRRAQAVAVLDRVLWGQP
jgi:HK97 family phage major capsid protein/HK97 family phage prohead protease